MLTFPSLEMYTCYKKHIFSLSSVSVSTAGLGCVWCDDSALHRHPSAPLVLQQEEIRFTQEQEELKGK